MAVAVEAADTCSGSCVVSIIIPTLVILAALAGMAYWFKTSQNDYDAPAAATPVAAATSEQWFQGEVQTATPAAPVVEDPPEKDVPIQPPAV